MTQDSGNRFGGGGNRRGGQNRRGRSAVDGPGDRRAEDAAARIVDRGTLHSPRGERPR